MIVEFESRVNLAPKTQSFCYTELPLLIIHRLLKARGEKTFFQARKISYMIIQFCLLYRIMEKITAFSTL